MIPRGAAFDAQTRTHRQWFLYWFSCLRMFCNASRLSLNPVPPIDFEKDIFLDLGVYMVWSILNIALVEEGWTGGVSTQFPEKFVKGGFHLNVVFSPLNVGLIELSRSLLVQFKPSLITQFYVLGFFVNFWVIFWAYLEGDSFSQRIG